MTAGRVEARQEGIDANSISLSCCAEIPRCSLNKWLLIVRFSALILLPPPIFGIQPLLKRIPVSQIRNTNDAAEPLLWCLTHDPTSSLLTSISVKDSIVLTILSATAITSGTTTEFPNCLYACVSETDMMKSSVYP